MEVLKRLVLNFQSSIAKHLVFIFFFLLNLLKFT